MPKIIETTHLIAEVSDDLRHAHITRKEGDKTRTKEQVLDVASEMTSIQKQIMDVAVQAGVGPETLYFIININGMIAEVRSIDKNGQHMRELLTIMKSLGGIVVYGDNAAALTLVQLYALFNKKMHQANSFENALKKLPAAKK